MQGEGWTTTGRRWRRIGASATTLLALAALGPTAAEAAPRGAPAPAVSAASLGGNITTSTNCAGDTSVQRSSGLLKVDRGNEMSGTISVDVTYGGTLVAGTDYPALPDPVVIPAGETLTILEVKASAPGTVTMTVEAGTGYSVGSPASATATIAETTVDAVCHPLVEQTIKTGERPAFLDPYTLTPYGSAIGDTEFRFEGTLPTGMSYTGGQIKGVATAPGVFEFTLKWCLGDDMCVLEVPYRITVVVPRLDDPPVTAPPAAPIPTTAAFTG